MILLVEQKEKKAGNERQQYGGDENEGGFKCSGIVSPGVTPAVVFLSKQQSAFAKALLLHSFVLAERK